MDVDGAGYAGLLMVGIASLVATLAVLGFGWLCWRRVRNSRPVPPRRRRPRRLT